jgi:hypothetical protein
MRRPVIWKVSTDVHMKLRSVTTLKTGILTLSALRISNLIVISNCDGGR